MIQQMYSSELLCLFLLWSGCFWFYFSTCIYNYSQNSDQAAWGCKWNWFGSALVETGENVESGTSCNNGCKDIICHLSLSGSSVIFRSSKPFFLFLASFLQIIMQTHCPEGCWLRESLFKRHAIIVNKSFVFGNLGSVQAQQDSDTAQFLTARRGS